MSSASSFPILTSLILVPAIGAVLVMLVSKRRPDLVKLVALLASMATAALTIWLLWAFDTDAEGFQFESKHTWIEAWGISWHLGVDGISLFLVVLTGVLFPLSIVATDPHHDEKPYLAWMLLLEAGRDGQLHQPRPVRVLHLLRDRARADVLPHRRLGVRAARLRGDEVLPVHDARLGVHVRRHHRNRLHRRDNGVGRITFDLVELAEGANFAASTGRWLFFAFAVAFAVKVPIFPLHTWLPDAHTQAPTAGSVVLAGVLLKLGTYGFLRFGLYLFPEAVQWSRPLFLTLGVIGITYGAIVAAMQNDLKRLVAYSSIAHLGFIVLGTFALTSQSISGSVMQMINHGISTGALFLLVGMIYERRHTREIAQLRGIQQVAPMFAAGFMVVMLSSIGVPGLNGFVGEYLILIGSFLTARWWVVIAAAGVILAALYLLWAYQRVFHGEPDEENKAFPEITLKEAAVLLPLIGIIVFTGVYPKPMLDRIEPSVNSLITHVEERTGYEEPQPPLAELEPEDEPADEEGSD